MPSSRFANRSGAAIVRVWYERRGFRPHRPKIADRAGPETMASRPSRFWFGTAATTCDAFAESQVWWSRKPSSVQHKSVSDGHLSRMAVARHLKRPTRDSSSSGRASPPIWPCSSWGLPCHGLLPAVRWALTPPFHPYPQAGGLFSVALSVAFRRPGVTWQLALRSSDFPRYDDVIPRPSRSTILGLAERYVGFHFDVEAESGSVESSLTVRC